MANTTPVLLLCIDGLSWDLLNSFFSRKLLPHLKQFAEEGVSGELQSIKPLLSPRIWATMYTGKRPDKHGIQDFFDNRLLSKQIWDILHENGETIGVFNPLTLYESKEVQGFLVPGILAQEPSAHPPELKFVKDFALDYRNNKVNFTGLLSYGLKFLTNGCQIRTLLYAAYVYLRLLFHASLLDTLFRKKTIETRLNFNVFTHHFLKHSPSFAVLYDNGIDFASHHYWKFMESQNSEHQKYGTVIENYYILIDALLGQLMSTLPDDWTIILVSDHGFKACPEYVWYDINVDALLNALDFENEVFAIKLMERVFLRPKTANISLEHISNTMSKVVFENGESLFNVTVDTDHVEVWVNNTAVDSNSRIVSLPNARTSPIHDLILANSVRSGTHDEKGVIMIKGPHIRRQQNIGAASVYDITPTILALKQMPIAKDMDGRVLTEVFNDQGDIESLTYIPTYEDQAITRDVKSELGEDEERNITERLKELGYL